VKKILSFLVRVCISAGVLLFLFQRVDITRILQAVYKSNKPILIFAAVLISFGYIIGFFRWRMLLKELNLNLPRPLIFRSFCIGFFSNLFFPSTIGGDLCRSADLSALSRQPRQVVASVVLDRLSGYTALTVVALGALLIGHKLITEIAVFFVLGIIVMLLAGILAILFNNFLFSKVSKFFSCFGRIGEALSNLHYEIYKFREKKKIISKNFLYSLIIQLIIPLSFYLLSLALATKISPVYFFILVPIISAITALPISIGGLGLREASSMFFFTTVGMSAEIAVTVSLLSFFIIFLLGTTGGIIYVFAFSNRRLQRD
jgi:hypothetical protein